jgi:putative peptidoglycan lipid II flippase
MLPAVIGLSATQVNIFINTFYAATCPQGSVSWLNYAYRLFHLPMGLFGVALSIATLPLVSRHAAVRDYQALKDAFQSSLSLAIQVTVPAACGLVFLSGPIIALIYQHGHFTAFDTRQTADALCWYALGLFAFAAVKIMVPVFYALNDTRIPVAGSFLTVGANLVFINLTLDALQHRAIALSTSLSMFVNFLFLGAMLNAKLGGIQFRGLAATFLKVGAASLAMGLAVARVYPWLHGWLGGGLLAQILGLGATIALGLGLYTLLLSFLGIPEFRELAGQIKAKLKK